MASSRKSQDQLRAERSLGDVSPAHVDASGTVASGQSEHALLAAGKIGVEEFKDMAVDRALSHLQGSVSRARLNLMREVLRTQLEQDPHLFGLVEQASAVGV